MKKLFFVCAILLSGPGFASGIYPVSRIPDSLIKNANAVIRLSESTVTVNSLTSVTHKTRNVVTILNKEGEEYSVLRAHFDKLQKVSNISGVLYNASGIPIRKLRPKDVQNVSIVSEVNLDDDNRMMVYKFVHHQYPYTVEYSYETQISHSFFIPSWIPQTDENVSIQQSSYTIAFPKDIPIRHQQFNLAEPQITEAGTRKTLKWDIKNRPAFRAPDYFSSWRDYQPTAFLAATDFRLDKTKGNMETWNGFGLFLYELMKGRDVLPPAVKSKVQELVANTGDDKEKITRLYKYLQENTRYISIQLGVGGWQPYDAAYVAKNGYGDCKALTNYMLSLLKEAGIESFYTLVYAGDNNFAKNRLIESFPSQQFNHVILCVPTADKDTMWLECTSQSLPAGYLSGFTANRKALMIKEDGGFLVSTPSYKLQDNKQERKTKVEVDDSGSAEIVSEAVYSGLRQDRLFSMISSISDEKIKRVLSGSISLPSYEIKNFDYNMKYASQPELQEQLHIAATHFVTMSGRRIFVTPNIFTRSGLQMKVEESRSADFVFHNSFHDLDYVEISLPEGYRIESAIRPVSIQTPFLKYEMSCVLEGNKIIYRRTFEQCETRLPAERQQEVVRSYNDIFKADRARLVLVKADE